LNTFTLDGVIQAGGGPDEDRSDGFAYGGWCAPFDDEAIGAAVKKMLDMPVDLLLGRKTFDIWAAFWLGSLLVPVGSCDFVDRSCFPWTKGTIHEVTRTKHETRYCPNRLLRQSYLITER